MALSLRKPAMLKRNFSLLVSSSLLGCKGEAMAVVRSSTIEMASFFAFAFAAKFRIFELVQTIRRAVVFGRHVFHDQKRDHCKHAEEREGEQVVPVQQTAAASK